MTDKRHEMRCQGYTTKGSPCCALVRKGTGYCVHHQDQAPHNGKSEDFVLKTKAEVGETPQEILLNRIIEAVREFEERFPNLTIAVARRKHG